MEIIDHPIVILCSLSRVVKNGRSGADDEATEDENPEVAGFPDLWRTGIEKVIERNIEDCHYQTQNAAHQMDGKSDVEEFGS